MTIAVLGAGSWGSALAIALSNIANVALFSIDAQQVLAMQSTRSNSKYLPSDIFFPDSIEMTSDIDCAVKNKQLLVIATPLSGLRSMIKEIKLHNDSHSTDIIWVCKGFEQGSSLLPHQVVKEEIGLIYNSGALIGPSFANEVACNLPTAISLVSDNVSFMHKWIKLFRNIPNFRVYANSDLIGSEVGSAVKNIIAIAVGISDGLNLGSNAKAALITRSLNEISLLVVALGGRAETLSGLTGIGDLILTCTGDLSRNRNVGLELARGVKLPQILANLGHVAEGVYATKEVYKLQRKLGISMPIVEAVYAIIYQNADIYTTALGLLDREPKFEFN